MCDLSNEDNVLEIKTFSVSQEDGLISNNLARQLYYESRGRKTFALSIDIDRHQNSRGDFITDAVNVRIYQITLEESEPKPIESVRILWNDEIKVLEIIKANPLISNADIARKLGKTPNSICKTIKTLVFLKYIKKEDESKRSSNWILLRSLDDTQTKYSYFQGKITLLCDDTANPPPI